MNEQYATGRVPAFVGGPLNTLDPPTPAAGLPSQVGDLQASLGGLTEELAQLGSRLSPYCREDPRTSGAAAGPDKAPSQSRMTIELSQCVNQVRQLREMVRQLSRNLDL